MAKFKANFRTTTNRFETRLLGTGTRFDAGFGSVQVAGGGSEVIVEPALTEGTKIATITVDDEPADLFAPTPIEPPVISVNGKTGNVALGASDVGAMPDDTPIPTKTSDLQNDSGFINAGQAPVQSVNGQAGDVTVAVPTKTSDLVNDSGYISTVPVRSVNNKTGAVSLSASDVGALPDSAQIPSKTSDLINDSGYITSAPVASVNGQTGAVVLDADDVGALPDDTVIPTKVSDLTNDSGFLTLADLPIYQGGVG